VDDASPSSPPAREPERRPEIWIVSTGTEILQGHYPDTNAQWLSREAMGLGFEVGRHMAIPDDHRALEKELGEACRRCDLVIMTGGLGPTADDLNRAAVARVYGVELERDAASAGEIEERFKRRGREMPPSNLVQADFPRGAEILPNRWGTAPGFALRPREGSGLRAALLALPGPPREMQPMFREEGRDRVLALLGEGRRPIRTLTLHTVGLAESHVNDRIGDLFGKDPRVNVALLAGNWRVDVRLTLQGKTPEENAVLEETWRRQIHERLGELSIWGEDETTFPGAVGRLLRERGQTLAVAESCTGGLIAKQITDLAGSSDYFLEGFVVYSNRAKERTLGVAPELIRAHGAVSGEVAEAMAKGAKERSGADWALSVTGVAGPGGGTAEKPVGLVFFGLAAPSGEVKRRRLMGFPGREAVRGLAAVTGLDILRRAILRADPGATE
jgi:nicotinamide-nucleotide amidase